MKTCESCGTQLTGLQRRWCSTRCKSKLANNKFQDYAAQKIRGNERQLELMKPYKYSCTVCGYNKNRAALTFHHLDPTSKEFPLDVRNCSNRSWDTLVTEAKKCTLLCTNCHAELHHPDLHMDLLI